MAPMIDMVFLLLVFFMTVSTLAKDARPELELAFSTTAAVPEEAPPRDIVTVMQVEGGYRFFWHNRAVGEEQLDALLKGASAPDGGGQVLLRGAPGLPWEVWERLLRRCRQAGVADVTFATFES